jgi:chitinase
MSYDMHGPWDSTAQPNTPNNEMFPLMDKMISNGFPKEKLILGLAFYGRTYKLRNPQSCKGYGCGFQSWGNPIGPCSGSDGLLFPMEIDYVSVGL